jgi:hypothetical protein
VDLCDKKRNYFVGIISWQKQKRGIPFVRIPHLVEVVADGALEHLLDEV